MQYLKTLETFELYDLLAAHTSKYTRTLSAGTFNDEDFSHTKEMIENIQAEIQSRDLRVTNCVTSLNQILLRVFNIFDYININIG